MKYLFFSIGLCFPFFLPAQTVDSLCLKLQPLIYGMASSDITIKSIAKKAGHIYHFTTDFIDRNGSEKKLNEIDLPIEIYEPNSYIIDSIKRKFHWVPNIKMEPNQIIGEHVFRSPCIIQTLLKSSVVLIPDLDAIDSNRPAPYYLDLNYSNDRIVLHYGIAEEQSVGHVYYQKSDKPFEVPSRFNISFYLLVLPTTDPLVVLRTTNQFLWQHFAKKYVGDPRPQTMSFEQYADTGYSMALKQFWVDARGNKGGITLSTFFNDSTKTFRGRDSYNDLWFQSWFNNMRTAYGLYSWGRKMNKEEWMEKTRGVTSLLLSAPKKQGWFATIYNTEKNEWIPSSGYGGMNDYYMPDNAWTAYWLLRFDKELEEVPAAKEFLQGFAKSLLRTQNNDGSFPSYIHAKDLTADSVLDHSAGSAMATWFLEEMMLGNELTDDMKTGTQVAILNSLEFLTDQILPNQRFEDFESFFSCSPKPIHYFDSATCMYSQNTLSIQWCAEALLKGYELFHDKNFLEKGEYCLNILSLYQQVWNPPFISLYAFGGFGVQNTDAEWDDARQAQFADTYLQFYRATGDKEYLERGIAACRASFALMVIPENKEICPKNYQGVEINSEKFSGSMAENYGHDGADSRSFQSGFHWGTGSALVTAAMFEAEGYCR
jgi:hypothetical protein